MFVCVLFVLEKGSHYVALTWNSCVPGSPQTQRSASFSLPSFGLAPDLSSYFLFSAFCPLENLWLQGFCFVLFLLSN